MLGQTLLLASIAGFAPALLWLWFWLREDKRQPEPAGLIALSFIAGAIAVPLVIPLQKAAALALSGTLLIVAWSAIEELFKIGAAYFTALRTRSMNEPVDAVIYMITAALGFSALENALFLLAPLSDGFVVESILTGNFRFIGATLLHTLTSATVGIAMALSFYLPALVRWVYFSAGLILAVILHALFNFFILRSNGETLLTIFLFVWIGIIVVILLIERIKRIKRPRSLVTNF